MKWSSALLAASCGLVVAHGDLPVPRLMGARRFLSEMKARRDPVLSGAPHAERIRPVQHVEPAQHDHVPRHAGHDKRQNTDGKCGPRDGSCAVGYCCSDAG